MNNKLLLSLIFLCIVVAGISWKNYYDSLILESLYKDENYEEIIEKFSASQNPVILHNLWNTYFKMFESQQDTSEWENALLAFSGSLEIEENEDTRFNYEYIKSLLDSSTQQEEDTSQQESENQNQDNEQTDNPENSGDDSEGSDTQTWDENQDWENAQQDSQEWDSQQGNNEEELDQAGTNTSSWDSERGEQYSLEQGDEVWNLSDEEFRAIQEQIENLKDQQIYNQRYYGKENEASDFDSLYESFFWNVDRGSEKNW